MFKWLFPLALCSVLLIPSVQADEESDAEAKRQELYRRKAEKKGELNGSEWEIQLKPQYAAAEGDYPSSDTLTFQDGQVRSKYLSEKGFTPTNYTITVKDEDRPTVWETMQTSQDKEEGIAFWRGQWMGEDMTGSFVLRQPEKPNKDYYFTSSSTFRIPPTSTGESAAEETVSRNASGWLGQKSTALVSREDGRKAAVLTPPKPKKKSFFWG